jgi:hypothetical protein
MGGSLTDAGEKETRRADSNRCRMPAALSAHELSAVIDELGRAQIELD